LYHAARGIDTSQSGSNFTLSGTFLQNFVFRILKLGETKFWKKKVLEDQDFGLLIYIHDKVRVQRVNRE